MFARLAFYSFLAAAMAFASFNLSGNATAQEALNDAQKKQVESVVQEYILKNPEILMRAIQEYQVRQRIAEREQAKKNLISLAPDLQQTPASPVIGNPKGDVTIVEFFDYRCGYCKRVFPTIQALLKEDGNIRYVLKEFPILGPDSLIASQASLAVWETAPDKYMDFHAALMTVRGQLNDTKVLSIAKNMGLDTTAIRKGMNGSIVRNELNKNMKLAESLGISGTPAFIVGENLVPGAINMDELKKLVSTARKG